MKIADVMTTDVVSVTANTPLKEVARLLVESGFSGFPVIDDDGTLLGVVSGADVLVKEGGRGPGVPSIAALLGLDSDEGRAEKFAAHDAGAAMTTPAVTIRPTRSVNEAAALMLTHSVNRLPVVDAHGELVGIVTRTDLLRAFIRADVEIEKEIKQDVVLQTLWTTQDKFHIDVEAGEVTLEGRVADAESARMLVRSIERVPGVVGVESQLTWP